MGRVTFLSIVGDLYDYQIEYLLQEAPRYQAHAGNITSISDVFRTEVLTLNPNLHPHPHPHPRPHPHPNHGEVGLLKEVEKKLAKIEQEGVGAHALILGAYNHWVCLFAHASQETGLEFVLCDSFNNPFTRVQKNEFNLCYNEICRYTQECFHNRTRAVKRLLSAFTENRNLAGDANRRALPVAASDLTGVLGMMVDRLLYEFCTRLQVKHSHLFDDH